MIDKTYRTVAQLIDILRSRGMVIEDGAPHDTAMRILETENYYNIVNGYKDLFLSPASTPSQEHYRNGTTFEELYALYQFDRDIRHIYLKYLLKVENTFKSVLAHEFSALYGHDNYLKLENFDAVPDNISSIIKLFGDIQQETARQMSKHHQAVTHSGTNDVYAIGIVFARLLGTADTAEFIASMSAAFSKLEQQLHTISIKDVMRIMGYPAAWERLQQLAR